VLHKTFRLIDADNIYVIFATNKWLYKHYFSIKVVCDTRDKILIDGYSRKHSLKGSSLKIIFFGECFEVDLNHFSEVIDVSIEYYKPYGTFITLNGQRVVFYSNQELDSFDLYGIGLYPTLQYMYFDSHA